MKTDCIQIWLPNMHVCTYLKMWVTKINFFNIFYYSQRRHIFHPIPKLICIHFTSHLHAYIPWSKYVLYCYYILPPSPPILSLHPWGHLFMFTNTKSDDIAINAFMSLFHEFFSTFSVWIDIFSINRDCDPVHNQIL